jgi:hypothetical protein
MEMFFLLSILLILLIAQKKVAEKYSKLEGIFPCYKKLTLVETLG